MELTIKELELIKESLEEYINDTEIRLRSIDNEINQEFINETDKDILIKYKKVNNESYRSLKKLLKKVNKFRIDLINKQIEIYEINEKNR